MTVAADSVQPRGNLERLWRLLWELEPKNSGIAFRVHLEVTGMIDGAGVVAPVPVTPGRIDSQREKRSEICPLRGELMQESVYGASPVPFNLGKTGLVQTEQVEVVLGVKAQLVCRHAPAQGEHLVILIEFVKSEDVGADLLRSGIYRTHQSIDGSGAAQVHIT